MVRGKYYLAGRSDFFAAELLIKTDRYELFVDGKVVDFGLVEQLSIAHRLGHIARKITLVNGGVFETGDNDSIDLIVENSSKPPSLMRFVYLLERNMAWAIVSIFITAGVVFSGFKWGIPAASTAIAHSLPTSTNQILSANALELLDEYYFKASRLDTARQEKIQQHFVNNIVPLYQAEDSSHFTLHFRLWPSDKKGGIPNALALPSGDIIVTDRFIELTQSQDEIDIVLLHEMGHVVERHSLERVIEGSAVAIIISVAFGDVSWVADMGIGIGSFLISSFYSQSHETEADKFAYEYSLKAGISPASLGLILARMEHDMESQICDKNGDSSGCYSEDNSDDDEGSISAYFSTHPSSDERAAEGKRYQACFEQGLSLCPNRQ